MYLLRNALLASSNKNSIGHKEIQFFLKKIDSWYKFPSTYSQAEKKIQKFIDYSLVAKQISVRLKNIEFDKADGEDYKILNYCILVLCFDASPNSIKTLHAIIDHYMRGRHNEHLERLLYKISMFKNQESLDHLRLKISDYLSPLRDEVYCKLESKAFVEKIGIEVPKEPWAIEFILASDPNPFAADDILKAGHDGIKQGIEINVLISSRALENGKGWEMTTRYKEFRPGKESLYGYHSHHSKIMYRKRSDLFEGITANEDEYINYFVTEESDEELKIISLSVSPSLLNLNGLMDDIEEGVNFKFKREIQSPYFSFERNYSKSLKYIKAINKWLKQL